MKHETKNTLEVTRWCNACRRFTQHKVEGKKPRHCLEHVARAADDEGYSQRQIKEREKREQEEREPRLF